MKCDITHKTHRYRHDNAHIYIEGRVRESSLPWDTSSRIMYWQDMLLSWARIVNISTPITKVSMMASIFFYR